MAEDPTELYGMVDAYSSRSLREELSILSSIETESIANIARDPIYVSMALEVTSVIYRAVN